MKEKIDTYIQKIKSFWNGKSARQKGILIGSAVFFITFLATVIYFSTRTNLVPLYSDLSPAETGSIKEALDARGVESEITNNGTVIKVPDKMVDSLLVELAAEGIPKSGSIDYSFFSANAGLGMTDNEFNIMKLDAMQTELANLIKSIDGIKDANVMINLPEKGIFVQEQTETASASIVLETVPGHEFSEKQIKGLYTLVSKSVPNLPTDNIVIMNQNFEYFDMNNNDGFANGDLLSSQYEVKKEIERDIQRQVQNLLGTLMGHENVIVSVTAGIDFSQETRQEELVAPVNEENYEGITISAQRLTESYSGANANASGIPGSADPGDTMGGSYVEGDTGDGDYERTEETINNEVNRIRKEIIESPYKIRDLGIQVIVELPAEDSPEMVSATIEEDIQKILSTVIRTSIHQDDSEDDLTDEKINEKIAVTFQPLLGRRNLETDQQTDGGIPVWIYVLGAVLAIVFSLILVLLLRKRRSNMTQETVTELQEDTPIQIPDLDDEKEETEETLRMKQIERMAKERPDEFAKLIRTWLSQD